MCGVPHHGIGRGFKVGKEEIVGLLTALDRFVKADDAADNARLEARLMAIAAELNGHKVVLVLGAVTGRVPVLEIAVPDALASAPACSAAIRRCICPSAFGARPADARSAGAAARRRCRARGGAKAALRAGG